MGNSKDVDDKFKKDVSKEIANLKEFLIQQGKEIVKIKQDVKNQREGSKASDISSQGVTPEIKAVLDKHQHALDKQKENITKLSKLCLGTLTELEKLEKDQQEKGPKPPATPADPRSEDKFKRLTDENKKLIQLVTALDQQVAVLEAKVERSASAGGGGLSRPHSRLDLHNAGAPVSREEIIKMISQESLGNKDFIVKMVQDQISEMMTNNKQRDGEVGGLLTQVDNLDQINRAMEKQILDLNNQIDTMGRKMDTQVQGQMQTALSKIEKLEKSAPVPSPRQKSSEHTSKAAAGTTIVDSEKSAKLEAEINNLKESVNDCEKRVEMNLRGEIWKLEASVENNKKVTETSGRNNEEKISEIEGTIKTLAGQINQLEQTVTTANFAANTASQAAEKAVKSADKACESADKAIKSADKASESADKAAKTAVKASESADKGNAAIEKLNASLTKATSESAKVGKTAESAKTSAEKALDIATKLQKDEAVATTARNESTMLSAEELKRDILKMGNKNQALEDKMQEIEKECQANSIEIKGQEERYSGQLSILSEKVKSVSLNQREDKIKTEEKISILESEISKSQSDETNAEIKELTKKFRTLEKSSSSTEEGIKNLKSSCDSVASELKTVKTKLESASSNIEDLKGKNKDNYQEIETVRDSVDKLSKKIDRRPVADENDKKNELSNKLYTDLVTKIDDVDSSLKKDVKKARTELDKLVTQVGTVESKLTDSSNSLDRKISSVQDETSSIKYKQDETSVGLQEYTKQVDKIKLDFKSSATKIEEISKEMKNLKSDSSSVRLTLDKVSTLEAELKGLQVESSKNKVTDVMKDINSLRSDLEKSTKEVRNLSTEVKFLDSNMKKDLSGRKAELDGINKMVKNVEKDLTTLHNMVEVLNSESGTAGGLSEDIETLKSDFKSCDRELKACKTKLDEVEKSRASASDQHQSTLTSKIKDVKDAMDKLKTDTDKKCDKIKDDIEKKLKSDVTSLESKMSKTKPDTSENDKKLSQTKDDLTKLIEKCKEDFNTRITLTDTKTLKFKDDMTKLNKECETKIQSSESKVTLLTNRVTKLEDSAKSTAGKKDEMPGDMRKELDKINAQIKDNLTVWEGKLGSQETQVAAVKQAVKEVADKIGKLDSKKGGSGVDTDNLQQSVKKLQTESPTKKDLEKVVADLNIKINECKAQNGSTGGGAGGGLDPNHPDIGPIMDSLIMTNDRPYVDCMTLTPMTGNGLVKFDRFTAMNKLPWDDANDQFVIQEPGVYAVFISGILQDALLSVKIASNMLEREVCCVGSREGILGVKTPTFVFKTGLFQIEDDDNVCETVFIEIHADNEDSFVDKNVSLTLYKIAESNGGE